MRSAAEEYRRLLVELEFERILRGGSLAQEVELAFAEQFEPLWNAMSSDEQAELETQLRANSFPGVQGEPHEEDCEVRLDSDDPPPAAS